MFKITTSLGLFLLGLLANAQVTDTTHIPVSKIASNDCVKVIIEKSEK